MQRRFRLRRSADIESLQREGHRWQHPLAILVVKENGLAVSRFGVSVSRRIGKATVRNRLKRLFREILRKRIETIQPGWDFLIIARLPAAQADYSEIETAVTQLLCRANVLNDANT